MIDRFYRQSEPDTDRYEPKPVEDIDVPDFDQPDTPVDPAEHAQHALIDALTTLEQQIVLATTSERLAVLKALTKRAYDYVNLVDLKCTAQMETLVEARR